MDSIGFKFGGSLGEVGDNESFLTQILFFFSVWFITFEEFKDVDCLGKNQDDLHIGITG